MYFLLSNQYLRKKLYQVLEYFQPYSLIRTCYTRVILTKLITDGKKWNLKVFTFFATCSLPWIQHGFVHNTHDKMSVTCTSLLSTGLSYTCSSLLVQSLTSLSITAMGLLRLILYKLTPTWNCILHPQY